MDIIDSYGLIHSTCPSTNPQENPYLILTSTGQAPRDVRINDVLLFNHFPVTITLDTKMPPLPTKEISYRRIKGIDIWIHFPLI